MCRALGWSARSRRLRRRGASGVPAELWPLRATGEPGAADLRSFGWLQASGCSAAGWNRRVCGVSAGSGRVDVPRSAVRRAGGLEPASVRSFARLSRRMFRGGSEVVLPSRICASVRRRCVCGASACAPALGWSARSRELTAGVSGGCLRSFWPLRATGEPGAADLRSYGRLQASGCSAAGWNRRVCGALPGSRRADVPRRVGGGAAESDRRLGEGEGVCVRSFRMCSALGWSARSRRLRRRGVSGGCLRSFGRCGPLASREQRTCGVTAGSRRADVPRPVGTGGCAGFRLALGEWMFRGRLEPAGVRSFARTQASGCSALGHTSRRRAGTGGCAELCPDSGGRMFRARPYVAPAGWNRRVCGALPGSRQADLPRRPSRNRTGPEADEQRGCGTFGVTWRRVAPARPGRPGPNRRADDQPVARAPAPAKYSTVRAMPSASSYRGRQRRTRSARPESTAESRTSPSRAGHARRAPPGRRRARPVGAARGRGLDAGPDVEPHPVGVGGRRQHEPRRRLTNT